MKNYCLLLLCTFVFTTNIEAQTFKVNNFYQEFRQYENTTSITLPGWLMRLGSGIARRNMAEDEVAREALKLVRGIRKMKLLVIEDNPVKDKTYRKLISSLDRHAFEKLISVRSEGTKVDILIREKKEKIRNLILLVQEEDEFVFLSLKTKLKQGQLNEFLKAVMKSKNLPVLPNDIENRA